MALSSNITPIHHTEGVGAMGEGIGVKKGVLIKVEVHIEPLQRHQMTLKPGAGMDTSSSSLSILSPSFTPSHTTIIDHSSSITNSPIQTSLVIHHLTEVVISNNNMGVTAINIINHTRNKCTRSIIDREVR